MRNPHSVTLVPAFNGDQVVIDRSIWNVDHMNSTLMDPRELESIIERTVKRTLEDAGVISKFITRKEMIKRIGQGGYNRGVNEGLLHPIKKGGRTATIYCLRSEFESFEYQNLV